MASAVTAASAAEVPPVASNAHHHGQQDHARRSVHDLQAWADTSIPHEHRRPQHATPTPSPSPTSQNTTQINVSQIDNNATQSATPRSTHPTPTASAATNTDEENRQQQEQVIVSAADVYADAQRAAEQKRTNQAQASPFPHNAAINAKIVLHRGDMLALTNVDAIVNSTNERLNDRAGIAGRILDIGGCALIADLERIHDGCPTGDAVLTRAFGLPANGPKHIIHTVGPRYSVRYQTAAENALHGCYRRVLEVLKNENLSSVAFCVINSDRKGYPREQAAHVALRTVRRFLDRFGDGITRVVLCVDNDTDQFIYQQTLPLYFPRSLAEEAWARERLPQDIGSEGLGEKAIPERDIRIRKRIGNDDDTAAAAAGSTALGSGALGTTLERGEAATGGSAEEDDDTSFSFSDMQDNPDDIRQQRAATMTKAELAREAQDLLYARYLARSREMNFSDLEALNFVYQSGLDSLGRPIIVIVGSHFPAAPPSGGSIPVTQEASSGSSTHAPEESGDEKPVDKAVALASHLERCLLYIIRQLDKVVARDYVLIYLHTNVGAKNRPPLSWLLQVYNIFNRKYKKNMKRLFLVHPNFWVRTCLWFVTPFIKKKFWKKMLYVDRLLELYTFFDARTLRIPKAIVTYDQSTNGAYYDKARACAERQSAAAASSGAAE